MTTAACSVASAGDVNGDGFDDVIVGAVGADAGASGSGASYVVFGKASGFSANINLSTLNGSNGFKLSGVEARDNLSGHSVASAGDVNGDGFADLIIGARWAEPNGWASGASYVVFGKASGFAADINLSTLNGSNGFKLSGAAAGDNAGFSVRLGRRLQWRRLRRPDHRGHRARARPSIPARATSSTARLRALLPIWSSPASPPPWASS